METPMCECAAFHSAHLDGCPVQHEIDRLRAENSQLRHMIDEVARDRNPHGKTLLDFYVLWLEQEKDVTAKLRDENAQLEEENKRLHSPEYWQSFMPKG